MTTTEQLVCGYCGRHRDPETACTCLHSQKMREAREREMERCRVAQRAGVATNIFTGLHKVKG